MSDFSHDSGIKQMAIDFPEDTVRLVLPGAEARYGKIQKVELPREENLKQWLEQKGRETDTPCW